MAATRKTSLIDVDSVFTSLKPRGFFQIAQFSVLALTFVVYAASLLKIIFIGILPEVKCANLTETQLSDLKFADNSSFTLKYEKCHIEVLTFNQTNQTLPCLNGYSYTPERSRSFVSEFDLVCDKEGFSELTQTLYSVGGLISSLTVPIFTDKYGRKKIHIILSVLLLGTGIGLSYAPDYWTFTALRLLEGIMNQGMIGPSFTMMLELLTAKERTIMAASTGLIWGASVVSLAPLAYLLHTFSWRINSLAFTSLAAIVFLEIWYIEESLRWLLTNGKMKESKKILHRAAKENGVNFDDIWGTCMKTSCALLPTIKETDIDKIPEDEIATPEACKVGIKTLITDGTARLMTIIVLINGLMNGLTYNMFYMTAAQLSGNYYLNYFLTSLMEVVGNIIMFFMIMRLERRTTMAFFQILSGSALILSVIINIILKSNAAAGTAKVILSLIGMLGISASYCIIWLYVPEIYPTNLRNVGVGMLGISGTIGNMISPFSRVVVLYVPWLPATVFGTGSILASLLLFVLPESSGQQLPSTMDDVRMWKEQRQQKKRASKNLHKNGNAIHP